LHKFAETSDRIHSSINASSIASNGATSPGGARTCGFKAALMVAAIYQVFNLIMEFDTA